MLGDENHNNCLMREFAHGTASLPLPCDKFRQVNQVVLCGKMPGHAGVKGTGGGVGSVGVTRRSGAARAASALGRWADALRTLNAGVAAKVNYR